MQKEEEALRGFLVGEARGLLESQRRIEKRIGAITILTAASLVLILAVLVMNSRIFARLRSAAAAITEASGSLNSLAKEMQAGIRDSRADISALKRRVDNLNTRLGKWENGTATTSSGKSLEISRVAGAPAGKAAVPETTKKKKGCLGIF